ncbi:MAG: hypothetical protein WC670_18795 [Pseudolabrys sp.]|jgi:hypothetical protein
MRFVFIIAAAVALAFAITLAGVAGQASAQPAERQAAQPAKKKIVKRAHRARGGQIACTAYGCHPIPPNCHPQTGYRWDGMPSGFDVVVCR